MSLSLIKVLLERGMEKEALEVTRLLEGRERDRPKIQALEFELDWLRSYLRREVVYLEATGPPMEDEGPPTEFEVVEKSLGGQEDSRDTWLAINGCPRLFSILQGQLPSLSKFQKGETP